MKFFDSGPEGRPSVGLSHGPWLPGVLARNPALVDHVELSFEQLRRDPAAAEIQKSVPAILHSESLSVAGFVPPDAGTLEALEREAARMRTPWLGEQLGFITADPPSPAPAPGGEAPTALPRSVCPQLSEETVAQVAANVTGLQARLPGVPILLENAPQYFAVPGSTHSMVDFLREVLARCEAGLLLDLSHFLVSSLNMKFDPQAELDRLPLERVVEIHLSGMSVQSGIAWEDHALLAPLAQFALLARALKRCRPRALTFEYEWTPDLPDLALVQQLERVRAMLRS